MNEDFYLRLKEIVEEINEHPYKNTKYIEDYGCRFSIRHLGAWDAHDYDTLLNGDAKTEEILNKSNLDLFIYCDRGGYIYVGWK
jgi:hypothetical protein